jgi:hypothetical protein
MRKPRIEINVGECVEATIEASQADDQAFITADHAFVTADQAFDQARHVGARLGLGVVGG